MMRLPLQRQVYPQILPHVILVYEEYGVDELANVKLFAEMHPGVLEL